MTTVTNRINTQLLRPLIAPMTDTMSGNRAPFASVNHDSSGERFTKQLLYSGLYPTLTALSVR